VRQRLKRLFFALLGKDPEAVIVSFLTGSPELASAMEAEIRRLEPARRHFTVSPEPGSAWTLYGRLRRRFRRLRIGLAPVLFDSSPQHRALRLAAFLLAPRKILAYNARGERHHLRLKTALASLLFLRGVPVDRIFLRPWKRSRAASSWRVLEGRPWLPGHRRVAVLAPYFPYPLAHGGAVRMFHLLREMAREFDLILLAFTEGVGEEYEPVLEFCSRVVLVERPPGGQPRWSTLDPPEVVEQRSPTMQSLWDTLPRELGAEARQVEYTQMASYGGDVLVAHDLNSDLRRQVFARTRTLAAWWDWWRWRRYERAALARYRRIAVMSERDAALARLPAARVIPNGVDLEFIEPRPEQPGRRLLFVGAFRHFPNVLACRFFLDKVWPEIPDATLTVIAGRDPQRYWAGPLERDRVRVLDLVRDVRPYYEQANVVIVPTLVAGGTHLKTLEAMAAGRAIAATPAGVKGLGLEHGVSAWIAEDAATLAAGIRGLLDDPALRRRLAQAARRLAEERFGWKRIGELQRAMLREITDAPPLIRAARAADVAELDRLQRTSPEAVLWEPSAYLAYDCRVAECNGRTVGFVVARSLSGDEFEVLSLVVDPDLRRRGVGSHLMQHLLDGRRRATWYLEVRESNWRARNLYKKLGFEDVSLRPGYYQDSGEAAVVMRLKPC
jgi:ribosomal-protein-alanine acetyltransferase